MKESKIAFILLAIAVITGAFGAHFLRAKLDESGLNAWHTAVEYQFYHGFGLLILSILPAMFHCRTGLLNWAKILMFTGVILFCGSIYLLSTKNLHGLNVSWLGPVTPVGGLCFIAAWLLAVISVKNYKTS